jgi:hypothetical protein
MFEWHHELGSGITAVSAQNTEANCRRTEAFASFATRRFSRRPSRSHAPRGPTHSRRPSVAYLHARRPSAPRARRLQMKCEEP